eukprot:COSAG05_NODE_1856_length_3955_cov_1.812241_4_plen_210_part_00
MEDRRLYCKDKKAEQAAKAARARGNAGQERAPSARWKDCGDTGGPAVTDPLELAIMEPVPEDVVAAPGTGADSNRSSVQLASPRSGASTGRRNSVAVPSKPPGETGSPRGPNMGRRDSRVDKDLGDSVERFAEFQKELKGRHRGHLVTRNSARVTTSDEVDFVQQPPARITPQQGLQKQRDLRIRRGSDLIYTFHGLNKPPTSTLKVNS